MDTHRRPTLNRAIQVGVVLLLAAAVVFLYPGVRQRLLPPGANAIHNGGALPSDLVVCGRTYLLESVGQQTLAAISADGSPVLVDTGLLGSCVPGACSTSGTTQCATVVYVRVGEDAYQAYKLSGGPLGRADAPTGRIWFVHQFERKSLDNGSVTG